MKPTYNTVPPVKLTFVSATDIMKCLTAFTPVEISELWDNFDRWTYGDTLHTIVEAVDFLDEIHEFAAENFDEEKILEVEKQLKQIAMYLKKKKILNVDLET